ncbi:hypothetical protein CGLO_17845 [Colletotrichum gloeosporioides Cg-14]|uniref:Amidase domain-containing protein n=1 Tax=Colletotrichum gloeosporioides (strain Cg-14) TaxID=1237896 RepID=T0JJZ4_COLGC|nr:hypothetical protein CGLO_17845 [Colletotrichum gloeosporioides Cg-14]
MDAYAWDDFLQMVNDTSSVTTLADVDPALIFPQLPGTIPDRYGNRFVNRTQSNARYVEAVKSRTGKIVDIPGLGAWLQSLEDRRERDLEDWMDEKGLNAVVWPANGDVGRERAEVDNKAAVPTWRNGVARSFGNFAIRQLGVPTVTVTMGAMNDTGMPVGLTFATKSYDDTSIISYAYAFEQAYDKVRFVPPRTPGLETDLIPFRRGRKIYGFHAAPELNASALRIGEQMVLIRGTAMLESCWDPDVKLEVHVDGIPVLPVSFEGSEWSVTANITLPFQGISPFGEVNVPDASLAMVVVVATAPSGRSAGRMLFV